MGLLSQSDIARYALAHGKIFEAVCDEPGCGKLIKPAELCVVLKWKKRPDGITFLGQIPLKHRCIECHYIKNPRPTNDVSVKGAGRGSKKVSREEAAKLNINEVVRRAVLSILKKLEPKALMPAPDMLAKLRKKKAIRELKKSEISATIRGMKKLKLIKYRAKSWTLPVQKVKKASKDKKNKLKKVVAKR